MRLSERVANYIKREALLEPEQEVVVGVSGGPDSLCLLDCLRALGFQPVVAHFDHHARRESGAEAAFVQDIAEGYALPFELGEAHEASGTPFSEESARVYRYRFLASVAKKRQIERIAVGHTASDQAETVLMHLLRGAGSSGLRGMRPITDLNEWTELYEVRTVSLVRPLLGVWRHETEAYCAERELAPIVDPSNQESRFFRNRLRNELLPELQTYNPRIQEVLLRTAKVMAAEAEAIDQFVDEHWNDWVTAPVEGVLAFEKSALLQAPLALQRATVRRAILELVPELRDVGFNTVERTLQSVQAGKRLTLQGGLDLLTLNGEAYLRRSDASIPLPGVPQVKSKVAQVLSIPFKLELEAGWRLAGAKLERAGEMPGGMNEVWFDGSGIQDEITIRVPRPGDRMAPFGMSGSIKLSDLFVNRKAPRLARERWPVITCGEEIIWVPGLHRADRARVDSKTQEIVQMRLLTPGDTGN